MHSPKAERYLYDYKGYNTHRQIFYFKPDFRHQIASTEKLYFRSIQLNCSY